MSITDPLLDHMLKNMESIFSPKLVGGPGDWLVTQREQGQTISAYQQGGKVNWINPAKQVIYLFLIDDSIDEETSAKMQLYCEAYFTGVQVKLYRGGQSLQDGKKKAKKIPVEFVNAHGIATRDNDGIFQINASDVLKALKNYKVSDTFCILAVTNQDLYPRDSWNYVYGLAELGNGCGVFSFCRHQVGFYGGTTSKSPEEQKLTWIDRAVGTMTHEIGHMFGLKHCIYYECSMNGTNGPGDGVKVKGKLKTLCPICLLKLKLNIKFDTKTRYQALIEASRAIGLHKKAAHFEALLNLI